MNQTMDLARTAGWAWSEHFGFALLLVALAVVVILVIRFVVTRANDKIGEYTEFLNQDIPYVPDSNDSRRR